MKNYLGSMKSALSYVIQYVLRESVAAKPIEFKLFSKTSIF